MRTEQQKNRLQQPLVCTGYRGSGLYSVFSAVNKTLRIVSHSLIIGQAAVAFVVHLL
jgi:hypothetical protein